MKKIITIIMVFSLILCFAISASAYDNNSNVILSINMGTTNARVASDINYGMESGTVTGPQDFCFDGENVYILNTTNNTVSTFSGNALVSETSMDNFGITATCIAADGNNLFALGTNLELVKVHNNTSTIYDISQFISSETIEDFKVIGSKVYIGNCDGPHGTTYCLDLSDPNNISQEAIYPGRIFDENTRYEVELLTEPGKMIGHSCKMTITDITTEEQVEIALTSDYWVFGAQFLGMDGDYYRIKFFEVATNPDYSVTCLETIRLVDKNSQVVGIQEIPDQMVEFSNSTKVIDNETYQMSTSPSTTQIYTIRNSDYMTVEDYESPLASIVEPVSNSVSSYSTGDTITRLEMQQTAREFYEFTWSCTSSNLSALTGWVCPRFITGAGSYTSMPYSYGGFDSTSEFTTKLSQGYHVGNAFLTTVGGTCGLDCSGFVSKCWGLDTRFYTGNILNVSYAVPVSEGLTCDAFYVHNPNNVSEQHVFLYYGPSGYGNCNAYECTKENQYDRVVFRVRSIDGFTLVRYNNVYDRFDPED